MSIEALECVKVAWAIIAGIGVAIACYTTWVAQNDYLVVKRNPQIPDWTARKTLALIARRYEIGVLISQFIPFGVRTFSVFGPNPVSDHFRMVWVTYTAILMVGPMVLSATSLINIYCRRRVLEMTLGRKGK